MTYDKPFVLAHISDLHICSLRDLRASELLNQRILGYLSWRLQRGGVHRREVLAALEEDLHALAPDHIVITGDLTHLGTPRQFLLARQFLRALGNPSAVTVIPGNHDAYIKADWDQTFALWADYMISDEKPDQQPLHPESFTEWPSLRIRGPAAIIGVSTARPSAPFFATGSVGHAQLQLLEKKLLEAGRRNLFRIVLIHHPPVRSVVQWRKRLTDATALRAVLQRCGADLVLHGHLHRSSFTHLSTPAGRIPSVSVPSTSALTPKPDRRACYHVYHVSHTPQGWQVLLSVRGYTATENRFDAEGETKSLSCLG